LPAERPILDTQPFFPRPVKQRIENTGEFRFMHNVWKTPGRSVKAVYCDHEHKQLDLEIIRINQLILRKLIFVALESSAWIISLRVLLGTDSMFLLGNG